METITPATTDTLSKVEPVDSPKRKCIDSGGTWDATTQSCIMPSLENPKNLPVVTDTDGKERLEPQGQEASAIRKNELELGVALDAGTSARQSLEAKQQKAILEEERQAQILKEPVRRELDPVTNELEIIPVIGPPLNFIQRLIKSKLPFLAKNDDPRLTEVTPEELRTVALTEIERIEIEKGLTDSEKFGQLAEALNIGELAKWIPGLSGAEKPSENVQTTVSTLRQLKTRARDVISNAETGDLTRSQAEERIRVIEEDLQRGESRIKMLIQNSPELKFNSDGVNFIEGKILETRIILQDGKLAAITGAIAESQMTDSKIYQALSENEDFTIPGQ